MYVQNLSLILHKRELYIFQKETSRLQLLKCLCYLKRSTGSNDHIIQSNGSCKILRYLSWMNSGRPVNLVCPSSQPI